MPQLVRAVTTSLPVSQQACLQAAVLAGCVFKNKLHAFGHLAMVGSWFNAVKAEARNCRRASVRFGLGASYPQGGLGQPNDTGK
jgi:hypothetical protein